MRWGDALFSDAEGAFDPQNGVSVEMSDRVFGENTDGMELFNVDGREIIVINSEYVNPEVNLPHTADGMPTSADDVRMLQNFQGVSVMEIAEGADGWAVVVDSPYNRRIHHNTPMTFSGPAAGHDLLKTDADPTGMASLGTFNNCGSGRTPWGTYLTCEENFNGYFGATAEVTAGRSSTRPLAVSSMRTPPMASPPMAASPSIWAMMSGASSCTAGSAVMSMSPAAIPRPCWSMVSFRLRCSRMTCRAVGCR